MQTAALEITAACVQLINSKETFLSGGELGSLAFQDSVLPQSIQGNKNCSREGKLQYKSEFPTHISSLAMLSPVQY